MNGKIIWLLAGVLTASIQAGTAGTLEGVVQINGDKVPNAKPLKMTEDPACMEKHEGQIVSERYVVDANKNVKNVFVYIKSGLEEKTFKPPKKPAVLDQKGCVYAPHVLGVMVGQPLKVLNSDRLFHNVHVKPEHNREVNKAMPPFSTKPNFPGKLFAKPEVMMPIVCDAHPWMIAYVGVLPHPFFAVTGDDGRFEIPDVPSGTYEVEVWHEAMGTKIQKVEIGSDAVSLNFTLDVADN